ncbi:TPA: hypothetical protein I8Y21_004701 [Klebsiella oxytoca]|uniref:Gp11 C-terminal domain-containing protein n=1 Tax=Klebsiella oxytoca TaxID=571 RepID=A0AAN5LCI0_KLEOX|nr:hypothetical protein [Klebsiella oxytoca]
MCDERIITGIKTLIKKQGRQTCSQLAAALRMPPESMLHFLRSAVEAGILSDRNGFYDVMQHNSSSALSFRCHFRDSYPWVEGNSVPPWVQGLAHGVKTCESVYAVAEVAKSLQKQGWKPFVLVYIDIRLSNFICAHTAENITEYVLRYLPFDEAENPAKEVSV